MNRKWDLARWHFRSALQIEPKSSVALNGMGAVYLNEKNYDKAVEYFKNSIACDPFAIAPRLNLAKIFQKEHKSTDAIKLYQEIRNIVPHQEISSIALLKIYMEQKDKDKVLTISRELYQNSRNPETLTNVGILFAFYGLTDEAKEAYQKAMSLGPTYKEAYWEAGKLYARLKEFDQAILSWKNGLKVDPSDQRFQEQLKKFQY